jgi:lipoic acid synthetase/lipoyl(octanoyl) transferase
MNDTREDKSGIWVDLDISHYAMIQDQQEILLEKRQRGEIPDVIILLEHFPCFTIGSGGGHQNLLASRATLEQYGITVHETSRGGNITYHGPGQLVCYPILFLEDAERDLHSYARKMEEVMIRTLGAFSITAGRKPEFPGVWVGNAKIGAMGIAVRKWVTMHGIALNVCPDLHHFSFIVPCGITGHSVTSMAEVLGHSLDLDLVRREMRYQFSDIFRISLRGGTLEQFTEEGCLEST